MRALWRLSLFINFLVCLSTSGQSTDTKPVRASSTVASASALSDFEFQSEGLKNLASHTNAPSLKKVLTVDKARDFTSQIARVFASKAVGVLHLSPRDPQYALLLEELLAAPLSISGKFSKEGLDTFQIVAELPEKDASLWIEKLSSSIKNGKGKVDAIPNSSFSKIDQEKGKSFSFGFTNQQLVLDFGDASGDPKNRLPSKSQKTPMASLGTNLFHLRLSGELARPLGLKAKEVEFWVSPRGENLRTLGKIVPEKPISSGIQDFVVPEIIRDPLLSFFAVQKVDELFRLPTYMTEFGLPLHTNQVFGWSDGGLPFQSFLLTELAGSRAFLQSLGPKATNILGPKISQAGFGTLSFTNDSLVVKGTPFVVPTLEPMEVKGRTYLFANLFPFAKTTNAFPRELLQELDPAKKLLYYDWEISESRISHWQVLNSLSPIFRLDQPSTSQNGPRTYIPNYAQLRWLPLLEGNLGNTVTEISLKSPDELAFVRNSKIGFTGMEIMALSQWLANNDPVKELPSMPMPVTTPAK